MTRLPITVALLMSILAGSMTATMIFGAMVQKSANWTMGANASPLTPNGGRLLRSVRP